MKHIYKFTMVVLLLSAISCAAQNDLQNEQRFHPHPSSVKPYIGLDLLRSQNPLVIIQDIPSQNVYQNREKYTTVEAGLGQNLYTELGYYGYDVPTASWLGLLVDKYTMDYNFQQKAVVRADYQHTDGMGLNNMHIYTSFVLNNGKPESDYRMEIFAPGDSIAYGGMQYYYDSLQRLNSEVFSVFLSSSNTTYYTYDSKGRLSGELLMVGNTFSTPDSSMRKTYTYDNGNRLISYIEEMKNMAGSPYGWTVQKKITYEYGPAPAYYLTASHIFTSLPQNNYNIAPVADHEYTYTSMGKPETYTETVYQNGTYFSKERLDISYDSDNNAEFGFLYKWNGSSYFADPSQRYLFSQNITNVKEPLYASEALKIFPNPAETVLHFSSGVKGKTAIITDELGRVVYEGFLETDSLDISEFTAGIYVILVPGRKPAKWIKA